ncbi:MAG: hypothetical protein NWE92_06450 [Candidatus Bathyarchaeota archaeon]|nr:hypothetical protein [Candidatus Bathyarchaeota archaeon]
MEPSKERIVSLLGADNGNNDRPQLLLEVELPPKEPTYSLASKR